MATDPYAAFADVVSGPAQSPAQRPQAPARQAPSAPRGIRNNNPGNIEDSPFARSLPGYAGSDGRFARFDSPEAGGQAKARLIGSYIRRGYDTPMEIINRWAPPSDNNPTDQYAAYVAQRAGVGLNDRLTEEQIPLIAQAIGEFETGQTMGQPQTTDDFSAFADVVEPGAVQAPQPGDLEVRGRRGGRGINVWADMTPEERMAIQPGDVVLLPDGRTVTAAGSPYSNPNAADRGQFAGGNLYTETPGLGQAIGAFSSAASEQIPFSDELSAATVGALSGIGYDRARQAQLEQRDLLNQTNRGARNLGGVTGALTTFALPGAAFIGRGGNLAGRSIRAAGVGGLTGAAYGAGAADEGGLGNRAQGAAVGSIIGGLTGGATPAAGQVASAASNFLTRPLGRAANWLTGGRIPALERFSPEAQAVTRISEALRNDGVSPSQVREAIDAIQETGVNPSMIGVIQRVAPGGEAARLIRGSAMQQGPASVAAERNLERVSGNLQDQAIGLTRRLTPGETRSPQEVIESLTQRRGDLARTEYAAPYATRVELPEGVLAALADEPGAAAIRRARAAAVARQDAPQVADLDAILERVRSTAPVDEALNVSAGALDRIQRAIGGRARKMEMSPDTRDIAAGLYGRQADVNRFLDEVPGLAQARGSYRDLTRQAEAVEAGQRGLTTPPDAFSFDELTRPSAAVGYRGALEQAIGGPAEGATGALNRIATSTNQTRNLESVFGPEASRYQAGLSNLLDELKAARFVASSSGSQTAPRLADSALAGIASLPTNIKSGLIGLIEKASRGATLTRAERQAIVELGVSEAQLREIADIPFLSQYLVAPASAGAGQIPARGSGL